MKHLKKFENKDQHKYQLGDYVYVNLDNDGNYDVGIVIEVTEYGEISPNYDVGYKVQFSSYRAYNKHMRDWGWWMEQDLKEATNAQIIQFDIDNMKEYTDKYNL